MSPRPGSDQPGPRASWLVAVLALVAGLAATLVATQLQRRVIEDQYRDSHARLAERSFDALRRQLESCALLVRAVQTLYLASDQVTAEEFERVFTNLDPRREFPSLIALALAERRDGPDGEHYPTILVAPRAGNERLVGLDIVTQPANFSAARRARDTDQPQLSAVFDLVQLADQPDDRGGVTLRLPIYTSGEPPADLAERREREFGSLAVSFRVGRLIETALPQGTLEGFAVTVEDISGGDITTLFHAGGVVAGPQFSEQLAFGGRRWQVRLGVIEPVPLAGVWLVFGVGSLASVLLAGWVWALLTHRASALRLAERMSRRYRDSEQQLRAINQRLQHQASHDALTGLANRGEFERRLEDLIAAGQPAAMLYLDLDQFKVINDTSGHFAGDQLIAQIGDLLGDRVAEGDLVARIGGDEFGVLLPGRKRAEAVAVAERLRDAVDAFVFAWEGQTFQVTVSIGVVLLGERPMALRDALVLADAACYLAKERGRNRVHVHSADDTEAPNRIGEMEWVNRVKRALLGDTFELWYQAIRPISGEAGPGAHVELLVRMLDDQGECIAPGAFIPAAERFGLMPGLDRWVVGRALADFAALRPDGRPLAMCAINLSGATLDDDQFPDFVANQLQRHGVPPERVCFEITETAAVRNMTRARRFIDRLRAAGCRFALDDFGAGMASFGYLKNLRVDYVKIDGSFIAEIERDALSRSIVVAVTRIAHQAGARVVAEFVNNDAQLALLAEIGVDFAQGYGVHRPQPVRLPAAGRVAEG